MKMVLCLNSHFSASVSGFVSLFTFYFVFATAKRFFDTRTHALRKAFNLTNEKFMLLPLAVSERVSQQKNASISDYFLSYVLCIPLLRT